MRTRISLRARATASVATLGVTLAGAVVLTASPAEAMQRKETPYAYQGSAYGTRVIVGDEQGSVGSGPTAWTFLGCTKEAPIRHDKTGLVGKVNANEMIQVGAVTSLTRTYRAPRRDAYGSRSANKVTDVVLGDPVGPYLKIGALRTTANAFARKGKLGAATSVTWTDLEIKLAAGDEPAPGTPLGDLVDAINNDADAAALQIIESAGEIEIPGVGKVIFGHERTRTAPQRGFATASAYALKIELENGSKADLSRAYAKIWNDVPAGVMSGRAYATRGTALNDVVRIGRIALQPLACKGTNGVWRHNRAAALDIPGAITIGAADSAVNGIQRQDGRARATARSTVARVDLGDGQLVVDAIKAQVNVRQNARGRIVAKNITGTTIDSITADGESHAVPDPGQALEIPGVAKIETAVVRRGVRGIQVTALRITLLDGSGAVLDIANAKVKIQRR